MCDKQFAKTETKNEEDDTQKVTHRFHKDTMRIQKEDPSTSFL